MNADRLRDMANHQVQQHAKDMRLEGIGMTYERRHAALIEYLRTATDAGDWHAVSDAANDLRVLEAQHPIHEWTIRSFGGTLFATGWALREGEEVKVCEVAK